MESELSGQAPKEVELYLILLSQWTVKNYIDDGAEDYTEIEFINILLEIIKSDYPDLFGAYNPKAFVAYSLCKYVMLLSRWEEPWYSHEDSEKLLEFIKEIKI